MMRKARIILFYSDQIILLDALHISAWSFQCKSPIIQIYHKIILMTRDIRKKMF